MKKLPLFAMLALLALPACETHPDVAVIRSKAEHGDARAQAVLGEMYANGNGVPQDYAAAAKWWGRSGIDAALYNLGVMYEQGKGVPQNYAEAARLYRQPAEQGFAAAQYNLGVFYEHGNGVQQDYAQAANWYSRAARQGHPDAQYNLAALYQMGKGVRHDDAESYFWLSLLARSGDRDAELLRDKVAVRLTKQQLSDLNRRAHDWKPGPA